MTVPSREEAARLLLSLDPPDWHLRHSRAVAEIAGWLALRVADADRRLVEAAALLHDVDKLLARGDRDRPHGEVGARWLTERGHPELADPVAGHPVTLLVEARGAERVLGGSVETRVVAYADKRAGQRLESMAARFAHWRRRQPHSRGDDGWSPAQAETAWRHATELEVGVCSLVRCGPGEVARLRWTTAALAAVVPERAADAPERARAHGHAAIRAEARS